MNQNIEVMKSFTLESIPNLDVCTLAALELFTETTIPLLNLPYQRPLVVGSGNAIATAKVIFEKHDAIFADESSFETKLANIPAIDGVILFSASGAKHAPIIAKAAKEKYGKEVILVTNNSNAPAKEFVDEKNLYVLPKNREPYTYNTSTYMGMLLSYTKEDTSKILSFIKEHIDTLEFPDFSQFKRYFLVVPDQFDGLIRLFQMKFIELFGRNVSRDVETFEYMKHAVTVVPAENELFMSFGRPYTAAGKHHFTIPLPENVNHVAMMAIAYYVIGKIQAQQPAWFKENIEAYTERESKEFGRKSNPIVE